MPDSTGKTLLRGPSGRPLAVAIISAPSAPDLAARAAQQARQVHGRLECAEAAAVLLPLTVGELEGLSFALFPWCRPIAGSRLSRFLTLRALRRPLLDWLHRVTQQTVEPVPPSQWETRIASPLRSLALDRGLPLPVRLIAREAIRQLERGAWSPVNVAMHGDLWAGNVLIDEDNVTGRDDLPGRRRFTIIDWPGGQVRGWPVFDLLKISMSMRVSARKLRGEIERHSVLLGGEPRLAHCHLAMALADLAENLGFFPHDQFAAMAHGLVRLLDRALEE